MKNNSTHCAQTTSIFFFLQMFLNEMGKVHLLLLLDAPLIKEGVLKQTNVTQVMITHPG